MIQVTLNANGRWQWAIQFDNEKRSSGRYDWATASDAFANAKAWCKGEGLGNNSLG